MLSKSKQYKQACPATQKMIRQIIIIIRVLIVLKYHNLFDTAGDSRKNIEKALNLWVLNCRKVWIENSRRLQVMKLACLRELALGEWILQPHSRNTGAASMCFFCYPAKTE